jgi:hypothetical protein
MKSGVAMRGVDVMVGMIMTVITGEAKVAAMVATRTEERRTRSGFPPARE